MMVKGLRQVTALPRDRVFGHYGVAKTLIVSALDTIAPIASLPKATAPTATTPPGRPLGAGHLSFVKEKTSYSEKEIRRCTRDRCRFTKLMQSYVLQEWKIELLKYY